MAFNKGYELKKFEAHWEKLRIEYAAAGMAEDAIQKMYDYDRQQFNSERTCIERTQEFTAPAYESTEEEASPLMLRYQEAITTTDTYHETKRSFAWIPELQIIPQEEFEAAQRIREDRSAHAAEEAEHHVPLRTRGQALLSNNVYCGHCGARLALTTSRKWRKLSDGTLDDTLRIRYTCYGKLRKQTNCTGQTGYTMHILDEIIDKMVRQIFSRLRGIPKEQLIISRYAKETAERKNHLQALQAERDKAEKDLLALKAEILAVIKGESAFPKDTLAEMIAAQEKKHTELVSLCEEASAELDKNAELMANVSQLYEELISYADLYDSASFESKKMIVSQLIRRVDVYRRYQIHVDFNFDLAQYLENSDELAC